MLFKSFAIILLTSVAVNAQPQLFSAGGSGAEQALERGVKRARHVGADVGALKALERIALNLFDDRQLIARAVRQREVGQGLEWSGEIEGVSGSSVTLVVDEAGRLTGSVLVSPEEFYTIRHGDDGSVAIAQVDFNGTVVDDVALAAPVELLREGKKLVATPAAAVAGTISTLDLLVVYTTEAKTAAGGASSILGKINLAISETNLAYSNSGINIQLRLVGAVEGGPSTGQAASTTYLSQVTGDTPIAALRNQYGADLVSVWVNGPGAGGGVVGIGWIMQNASVSFQSVAYSVVEVNFTNGPYYSFGHEIGHNLGGAHDRANASAGGAYPYSYGMQQPAGGFVTVMAYTGGCSNCRRVPYFSNPNVSLGGYPTGVVSTATDSADMAQTFNATRSFAEQWRATVVPVTAPATYAPTVTSVTPSAGNGASPVFTAVFEDRNGAADIRTLLVAIQTGSAQNACLLTIDRPSGTIILRNNADTGWIGGAALGQAATISNSQCVISGSGVTITPNGNSLTLVLPVNFLAVFAGTHDVYLKAEDFGGLNSSWQKLGTWTAPTAVSTPVAPVVLGLSPNSGTGTSATFTFQVSDANGATNLDTIQLLVSSRFSGVSSCHIAYLPATNLVYLLNDGGTAWTGGQAVGSGNSLQNSQCSLPLANMQAVKSGGMITLTLAVSFAPAYAGQKFVYGLVADRDGLRADWAAYGIWNVSSGTSTPVAPVVVSLTPRTGSGTATSFTIQTSDGNGFDNIDSIQLLVGPHFTGTSSCHIAYLPNVNLIYLLNDNATAWTGGLALGSANTIQNTQCSLALASAQAQKAGNTVTLTVQVSFASAYAGTKTVYGLVVDRDGLRADWAPYGTWTSP